jgi:hypothetical protein
MADITMCSGKDCPLKDSCYRFNAKKSDFRQSYFVNTPLKDGKCHFFWGERSQSIINQLKNIMK